MLIQWGNHGRQRVSAEQLDARNSHWLVVVHGGAWRDARITHEAASALLSRVTSRFPSKFGGVASCDYRLSPEVQDPDHMLDCAYGLAALRDRFGVESVSVVGHSCGAFIAGQLASLDALPGATLPLIASIVGAEGIYDLAELVKEYPDYAGFVTEAFGHGEWPVVQWSGLPLTHVVQSRDDELLDMKQTELVLKSTGATLEMTSGAHDVVFEKAVEWIDRVV